MANYVNNKEIMEEMRKYKESGKISERLGEVYYLIAMNLSNRSNYIGYTWKDDMVAEAVLTCVKYCKNFDPDKSDNPFGYISKICNNAFLTYIKKQNRHGDIKQRLFDVKDMIDENSFFSYTSIDYTLLKNNESKAEVPEVSE